MFSADSPEEPVAASPADAAVTQEPSTDMPGAGQAGMELDGSGVIPQIEATDTSEKSKTPADAGRVLLIHGYSASGEDFMPWRQALTDAGINAVPIAIGNYVTLNNDVSIKDLGEAFDRALRMTQWSSGTKDDTWTFDAIVHSTGMLVLRQWLTSDPFPALDDRSRIRRLKHFVGLAPATFGSPQAQKGRSWLGALVKGNRHLGPDFLNAGNKVLDGLELGSQFTWELAHRDMVCDKPLYDKGSDTPYVTVFIGNKAYSGIAAVSNSPGCDGTVRWAGCALDTRKVSVDLRRFPQLTDPANPNGKKVRCNITPWVSSRLGSPIVAVDGLNHGSIIEKPADGVAQLIKSFFEVQDEGSYVPWAKNAEDFGAAALIAMNEESQHGDFGGAGWQQLAVHVVDDHGDGVTDYRLQLYMGHDLAESDDPEYPVIPLIVDTYTADNSYRCFYLRLSDDMLKVNTPGSKYSKLWLELIASSGSNLLEYEAYTDARERPYSLKVDHDGGEAVKLDLTALATGDQRLLYPYTTTLLEIFVEREPLPLDNVSQLFNFLPPV